MPIPDYQSFMRPLLVSLSDGDEHRIRELYEALAKEFDLTQAERTQLLPSGKQPVYQNRIGWAKTYLAKAGLVSQPKRGVVVITEAGRAVLDNNDIIDNDVLKDFESFQEFVSKSAEGNGENVASGKKVAQPAAYDSAATPEEVLENLYQTLRRNVAEELLDAMRATSPEQFERIVVDVLVAMGYGGSVHDAGQAIGGSSDNGIDGIIKQDRLGVDNIYVQAKRWQKERPVGSPEVRTFAGSLAYHKATRGVFLTTSTFTDSAVKTASQLGNIVLIDGMRLADLMIEFDVGVSSVARYELKRVDHDYIEGD